MNTSITPPTKTTMLHDQTYSDLEQKFAPLPQLKVIEVADFLQMTFPEREMMLSPWLPTAGLSMIHARPGVGKTHVALGIAYAVATGKHFLGWKATKPRGVLYIDGEMPAGALQERLASLSLTYGLKELPARLSLLTPDLQKEGMPDLATEDGQRAIDQFITDDIELIVVDNLSCLVRTGKENESESWRPIQTWALRLRAKNKSVLFLHHSGKSGSQRGSSKKEDVLDTVIHLKRSDDYTADQGASFIVTFEKTRGFCGDQAKDFLAQLTIGEDKRLIWTTQLLEESTFDKVVTLFNEGMLPTEIANELAIHKSNVSRHIKNARAKGLIKKIEEGNHTQ